MLVALVFGADGTAGADWSSIVAALANVAPARLTRTALEKLPRFKDLGAYWVEVDRLENEGDRLYRRAVAELFGGEHPAIEVLKLKDIIDELEKAIDKLEDVSDVLEAIALKNA